MIAAGKTIFVAETSITEIMKRTILLLTLLYMLSPGTSAQTAEKLVGSGIETNFTAGKVFKHTEKFRAEVPDHSTSFEVNYIHQTHGKKPWHQRRNFPLLGFAFSYTNYGIDSIYGKCLAIYPNLEIPVVKGKYFEWTFKAAFGLGYATRKFERHPTWDTLNTAIGSHFNNYSYFATNLRYRINEHWDVQAGLNFSHMSNAAFRQPNLGINMYGAHIGARYFPVSSRPEKVISDLQPLKNRWLGQIRFGISGTELSAADGPLYPVYLVSAYASKRYLSKNKAFAGVDYSYHEHVYAFQRNNEVNVGKEKANSWKGSFFFGNEFLYGRVGLMFQVGIYFKQATLAQDPYYQKLGANVYAYHSEIGILKVLLASVLLKTHLTQAELVEIGIGAGF